MVDSHPTHDFGRGFVGRQRELAELTAALDDALSGRGRLLMLVGDPGIGKTRTAQGLAGIAESREAQVLWGRCYEGGGAPPYWPWIQPLRNFAQSIDPDELAATMGSGAADIAEIVSEVSEILPDLSRPPEMEPEQARFRVFDSIARFLYEASQVRPLMIVLDDLHWADLGGPHQLDSIGAGLSEGSAVSAKSTNSLLGEQRLPFASSLDSAKSPLNTSVGVR